MPLNRLILVPLLLLLSVQSCRQLSQAFAHLVQPLRRLSESASGLRQLHRCDQHDNPHSRANHCQHHFHRQTSAPI